MKAKYIRFALAFVAGSALYPCIEWIYRGRSHISMALLGGVALVALVWINDRLRPGLFLQKALLGAVVITQLEWIFGVIVNLHLGLTVWDYSDRALNVMGQICPLFSFYWFLISLAVMVVLDLVRPRRKSEYKKRQR